MSLRILTAFAPACSRLSSLACLRRARVQSSCMGTLNKLLLMFVVLLATVPSLGQTVEGVVL
jgi:hypothetical protein